MKGAEGSPGAGGMMGARVGQLEQEKEGYKDQQIRGVEEREPRLLRVLLPQNVLR